jgi:hypothetical protein
LRLAPAGLGISRGAEHVGRCRPQAECARSTVAEALKVLEWAGVITWQNRITRTLVRRRNLFGRWSHRWTVIRTSNAYVFRDPQLQLTGVSAAKSENQPGTPDQDDSNYRVKAPINPDSPLAMVGQHGRSEIYLEQDRVTGANVPGGNLDESNRRRIR